MTAALVLALLCSAGAVRTRPAQCAYGHRLRRMESARGGWSLSVRGLCYVCGDQSARMSAGGSHASARRGGSSQGANARRSARAIVGGRNKCVARRSLFLEIWAGGTSRFTAAAAKLGATSIRVCKPKGLCTRVDKNVWVFPDVPRAIPGWFVSF